MRSLLLIAALACLGGSVYSQKYVYTIKADSVKITNCDSAELILENHTQGVPGFLFNTGNGRTQFQRGLINLGNGSFRIGADTLNAWVQGGNSWGTTGVFGTLDNNPVNFYTDNARRMSLLANGRLLLGTTTDDGNDNLQVAGNIYTGGALTNSTTLLGAPSGYPAIGGSIRLRWGTSDGEFMSFYPEAGTAQRGFFGSGSDTRPFDIMDSVGVSFLKSPFVCIGTENSNGATLSVLTPFSTAQSDFTLGRFNADSIIYDVTVLTPGSTLYGDFADHGSKTIVNGAEYIAGNVGIGVSTPTAQLHTTGSVRFAGLTVDSTQNNVLVCDNNGNLYLRSAGSLAANDFPRSSLAVNGTIRAQKLTLRPEGWADYVFDSSYALPSLSTVAAYIRREHHLPGILSSAEVEKNGIDVGDNQTVLVKKVEELTLYIIELNKQLESERKETETLRQEMDALKASATEK